MYHRCLEETANVPKRATIRVSEHLGADRGWELIRKKEPFTAEEGQHLRSCVDCHEFITAVFALARSLGLIIKAEVPYLDLMGPVKLN